MGVKFKNQMNNKSLYNGFFNRAAGELPLFKRSQTNHDPRTENKNKIFIFINNVQATSDRVQAKNSQAKRGALINFFYN